MLFCSSNSLKIPGSDPLGAFGISIVAVLLGLLKKDPASLFAPQLPISTLVKRDLPELVERIPELELAERGLPKRQIGLPVPGNTGIVPPALPSLSQGIPGVGFGALPGSGIPGISPDLSFLVGSIAKNIALPGGNGIGGITNQILGNLNGVVPNFLFQLPVVQDSVATFGVLQLLSSINPSKFKDLAGLTSLAALQQAASGIPTGDLNFVKTLPVSPDPKSLVTTIMTLAEDMLALPGNVQNLKAATSVLTLRNLGLDVPGL
ncbi:hypothetical protein P154DRAFT_520620 [Amniculicola lignicola CBS 123094]|uniref:Uncharacterized protein n=1 Tax=Amniculicola lignicola CBS 123094 TaxID=1392246 RepID=A0A6A5WLL3_9PLEO|nr:hypothetical protein P154DRAFT_520620 [Amniculicola lignicola CBS 123094]